MKHTTAETKDYNERLEWFVSRIGKRVWRDQGSCECETCRDVFENGVVIQDRTHAVYLTDVSGEMNLPYFDVKPREYQILCTSCNQTSGLVVISDRDDVLPTGSKVVCPLCGKPSKVDREQNKLVAMTPEELLAFFQESDEAYMRMMDDVKEAVARRMKREKVSIPIPKDLAFDLMNKLGIPKEQADQMYTDYVRMRGEMKKNPALEKFMRDRFKAGAAPNTALGDFLKQMFKDNGEGR